MLDRAVVVVSLCFISALANTGCSSSDSGSPAPSDGGSDTAKGDVGGTDTKTPTDTAVTDTGPAVCWVVTSGKPAAKACDDCSNIKCNAERQECFGPGYLGGTFGGTCKDYITCQCGCSELDDICQENCKVSSTKACQDCTAKINACENSKCPTECAPPL